MDGSIHQVEPWQGSFLFPGLGRFLHHGELEAVFRPDFPLFGDSQAHPESVDGAEMVYVSQLLFGKSRDSPLLGGGRPVFPLEEEFDEFLEASSKRQFKKRFKVFLDERGARWNESDSSLGCSVGSDCAGRARFVFVDENAHGAVDRSEIIGNVYDDIMPGRAFGHDSASINQVHDRHPQ